MTQQIPEAARFIPYRRQELVQKLLTESKLRANEKVQFEAICEALTKQYHFRFHHTLEVLKDCYAPMNPDTDTKELLDETAASLAEKETALFETLTVLLDKANFERITHDDLEGALAEESLFKIKLQIDFDDFEQVLFFRRGESIKKDTLVSLFGLKKKPIEFINYDRVVMIVKFKPQAYFDQQEREGLHFQPGATIVKYFRNIPRADLEMLFPNSEVRMKSIDKLIIGVPAAVGGVIMLATKLGTTLLLSGALISFWLGMRDEPVELNQTNLLVLAAGFGTLGAFLWKQFSNFKNRKIRFMKTLSDNLYFKNLDNNMGVFHRLVDTAEEEECKEAFLAYHALLEEKKPMTSQEIDRKVEVWFVQCLGEVIDFEIADALNKLLDLGLVVKEDHQYKALSLSKAKTQLAKAWKQALE